MCTSCTEVSSFGVLDCVFTGVFYFLEKKFFEVALYLAARLDHSRSRLITEFLPYSTITSNSNHQHQIKSNFSYSV